MAGLQVSLTNRKLNFARIQQRLMQQAETVPDSSSALEAGLCFLLQTYLSLLAEVAEAYRHKGEQISSLAHLKQVLAEREITPVELDVLTELEMSPSWLSQLLKAQQLMLDPDAKDQFRLQKKKPAASDELALLDLSKAEESDWGQEFTQILEAMPQLIERIRDSFSEY